MVKLENVGKNAKSPRCDVDAHGDEETITLNRKC